MVWWKKRSPARLVSASIVNAQRDALVLCVLIAAVAMLIWNGSSFFQQISLAGDRIGTDVQIVSTALTLNVALILFGWRRYIDLRLEAERLAESEHRAAIAASSDPVTGLLNRKGFADKGPALVAAAGGRHVVILSLQLNRLKAVSDRHGYDNCDALRRCIAAAILDVVPADALVARVSGDEFAVAMLLPEKEIERAQKVSEQVLRTATQPFEVDGVILQVGAFAGMSSGLAEQLNLPDLLRRADIAMDQAKIARSTRSTWFDEGMERALLAHTELEQGIRYGLEHEHFVPFYEPQVDLASGRIVGFEVLARWKHPLSGIIGAETFIPVAEDMGMIGKLSEQVIRAALIETRDWDPEIKIAVNVSPSQLADGWLAERIVRLLTETGFPAERLVVEITETSLFADADQARTIVTSLKNQGIRIALDDFGTGFSSLSHLRSLPFDSIKVDRSFVTNIESNRESAAIVSAVSTLAHGLNVPVAIEGIESEGVYSAVRRLGCAYGQGWYFGKPMPGDQAAQLLSPASSSVPVALPPRTAVAG